VCRPAKCWAGDPRRLGSVAGCPQQYDENETVAGDVMFSR
jgi:hypothetical protein